MASCSTSKKEAAVVDPQKALAQTQWYEATREPLTYCPKGHVLPTPKWGMTTGEYVYLADRKSRFYIPEGKDHAHYRQQALAVREASLAVGEKHLQSHESVAKLVGGCLLRLGLTAAVLPIAVSGAPIEQAMEAIWSE